jgi:hypothetical protein
VSRIPGQAEHVLIIAEGLFMYLEEKEIRALIGALETRFPDTVLIFDAFSKLTTRFAGRHPSLKKTGAVLKWGIDDPLEIEQWNPGFRFEGRWCFSDSDKIPDLSPFYRFMFRTMGRLKAAARAHSILNYSLRGLGKAPSAERRIDCPKDCDLRIGTCGFIVNEREARQSQPLSFPEARPVFPGGLERTCICAGARTVC